MTTPPASAIEIELSGARVRVSPGVDPALLADVGATTEVDRPRRHQHPDAAGTIIRALSMFAARRARPRRERHHRRPAARHTGAEHGAHRVRASGNKLRLPARHGQNDRALALNRKNALFAGHDLGAENWAVLASLIKTCKLPGSLARRRADQTRERLAEPARRRAHPLGLAAQNTVDRAAA